MKTLGIMFEQAQDIVNIEMQIHSEDYEDIIDSVKPFVKIYEE